MKNILFLLVILFFVSKTNAQQYILLDSVPELMTDTQSLNENPSLSFYNFNMPPDSLPIFYEKKLSSTDTASIWCKNINSMSSENLFLQSGNGIIFKNPIAGKENILWCVSNFQGQFDVYGFRYDNNFNITDTLRVTNDTIVETSIALQPYYTMYWIQKNDSLLISQFFGINQDSVNLGTKDTLSNKCLSVYANTTYGIIYTKFENDSIHLYFNGNAVDTSGNVTDVNVSINMTIDNYLWKRNDSIFTYYSSIVNNYILINQSAPYVPYKPSIFDQYLWIKFMGIPLLAYTIKDTTNNFALAFQSNSELIGNKKYDYFYNYNATSGEAFSYLFPSNYDIQEIKMFPEVSNGMLYIVIRILVNNYERLYCLKASTGVGIHSEEQDNHFSIYPNPTKGNFLVELPENTESSQLTISNTKGQIIRVVPLNKGQTTYQFKEKLPAGVYFVMIQTNKGAVIKKIVKQ